MSADKRSTDYMRVVALMKEIKSPDGFEPLPWSQIRWHMAERQPLVNRLWGWLASKTLKKGHWSPYAMEVGKEGQGIELHLENAAADLGADEANVRRAWREGVDLGYWRNGTKAEGVRRLYIRGNVPAPVKGEQKENEKVCTDLLPPRILQKIKDWDPEKRRELTRWWEIRLRLRDTVLAEVVSASRDILDQDDDTGWERWGLAPNRNKEHKNGLPPAALEARKKRIEPLLPGIQRLVQTCSEFVQTPEFEQYKNGRKREQTSPTLLPETTPRERQDPRSVAPLDTGPGHREASGSGDGKKSKQQYAPQKAAPASPLNENEKQAVALVFDRTQTLQESFPRMDFSKELISAKSKNDQLFALRVVSAVGPGYIHQFFDYAREQLKKLDRNSLGKLPGRGGSAGPRSLGLILDWAMRYGEKLDDAARMEAEEQRRWNERELAACREILADPAETADAKFVARQRLAQAGEEEKGAGGA